MNNVGTPMSPKSWLHERTIALLFDELTRPDGTDEEIRARLEPGGEFSHNLREGVSEVRVPDEWTNIGGVVPDLILYGEQGKPIRIIEITVTSPPSDQKRQKLDALRRRGVDVVEIRVRNEEDLVNLCMVPWTPKFNATSRRDRRVHGPFARQHDRYMKELMSAIQGCSPKMRRQFWQLCASLGSLNALFPIRASNPYKEKLENPKNLPEEERRPH